MSHDNFKIINHKAFVAQHMDASGRGFAPQLGEVQIYPLSIASSLIKSPTPLFRADYSFLLLFSDGGGKQQVDNDIIELKANDVLFIREGYLNAIKSIDANTAGYFIHIDRSLLPQVFADAALLHRLTFHPKHAVSPAAMQWLCQCCELILLQQANHNFKEIKAALLKALVLKLAEASAAAWGKPNRQFFVATSFKELLYENFLENRDVGFYADLLAVSENYLTRCVNAVTAKPPKQHINEMVVVYGKVLLQDGSKDVSQVAFELNFSDPSYFGRLFKQVTKQTPTEYRNAFTQGLSG